MIIHHIYIYHLVTGKISRRTSRVKSLNQAQKTLDDAIKEYRIIFIVLTLQLYSIIHEQLPAETITEQVMLQAQVIMRSKVQSDTIYSSTIEYNI